MSPTQQLADEIRAMAQRLHAQLDEFAKRLDSVDQVADLLHEAAKEEPDGQ